METISKHIGEGFAKGELYAALAYDANDKFGGMQIKGISLIATISAAYVYPLSVKATFALDATDFYSAAARVRLTIAGNTDISAGFGTAIRAELRIEGHTSSTAISADGTFAGVEGRYYTDNTNGIAVSDGIHCALSGLMLAGQYYVISGTADYCGLAILDSTHISATISEGAYSGILIGGIHGGAGHTMGNAIKVGAHITNFLEIVDDDAIGSYNGNTATTGNPDGYIRVSIGGANMYIWTYTNRS